MEEYYKIRQNAASGQKFIYIPKDSEFKIGEMVIIRPMKER